MPIVFRMKQGGKLSRVFEIVNEGPATTEEVGAELGIPTNNARALLCDLRARGLLKSEPFGTSGKFIYSVACNVTVRLVPWDGSTRRRDQEQKMVADMLKRVTVDAIQLELFA